MKCVDVNECVEQRDLCPVGQYCVNTEGSYKCEGVFVVTCFIGSLFLCSRLIMAPTN